jgi:hypothetical protein
MHVVFDRFEDGRQVGWTAHLPRRRPIVGTVMNAGTKRPPHDLVQLAVEAGLGLRHGFWGCVASGARFRSMPARRTRPSRSVIVTHRSALDEAEQLAGRHFDAWMAGSVTPAAPVLDRLLGAWADVPAGSSLTVAWPSGLIVETPLETVRKV